MRQFREARLEALRKARREGKRVPPDTFLPFSYITGDEHAPRGGKLRRPEGLL